MDIQLTLAAIERFEDAVGVGLLSLVDGADQSDIKANWTVRRLRLLAQCAAAPGTTPEDIEAWLAPSRLIESQLSAIIQVIDQLTPPPEADEYLSPASEGGESTGNSASGAGSSS